ncbi:MAG TPA: hypothetical protein VLE20_10665 [Blastocatellia bacterium]|nr:hypothetical protein [Blastocatellia bacterium]
MSKRILNAAAVMLLLCGTTLAQAPCYGVKFDSESRDIEWQLAMIATELEQDPWVFAGFPYMGDCTFRLIQSPQFTSKPFVMRLGNQRANRAAMRRSVREFLQWWRRDMKAL